MYHVVVFERLVVGGHADTMPRHIPDQHLQNPAALAYAFRLPPPPVTLFELSSSWRAEGGTSTRNGPRSRDGLVYRLVEGDGPIDAPSGLDVIEKDGRRYLPIGKVRIMQEGERVYDRDPLSPSDFYRLSVV